MTPTISYGSVEIDGPADRIGVAEELPDHGLIDHGDAAGVAAVVVGGQEAAGSQPRAERLEEPVRHVVDAADDQVAALRLRHRAQELAEAAAGERNPHRRARGAHARQRAQALEHRLGEGQPALGVGIRRIRQRQIERQHPLRREAGVGADGAHQAAAEQAGGRPAAPRSRRPGRRRVPPARRDDGPSPSARRGASRRRGWAGAPATPAARRTGRPVSSDTNSAKPATRRSSVGSIAGGRKSTACAASTPMASEASPRPAAPPMRASTALSVSS